MERDLSFHTNIIWKSIMLNVISLGQSNIIGELMLSLKLSLSFSLILKLNKRCNSFVCSKIEKLEANLTWLDM